MTLDDDLTEEDLAGLAEDGTDEEKQAVARHPNASLQTLLYLAETGFHDDADDNPLLPLHIEVASDEVVFLLEKIAEKTKRVERLEEMASSVWDGVRYHVAMNAKTPLVSLAILAKDDHWNVRRGVAWNSNTPLDTLFILAKDKQWSVRDAARTTLNKLEDAKR